MTSGPVKVTTQEQAERMIEEARSILQGMMGHYNPHHYDPALNRFVDCIVRAAVLLAQEKPKGKK
jgi:hypothetical protein